MSSLWLEKNPNQLFSEIHTTRDIEYPEHIVIPLQNGWVWNEYGTQEGRGQGYRIFLGRFVVPTINYVTVHTEGDTFLQSYIHSGYVFFPSEVVDRLETIIFRPFLVAWSYYAIENTIHDSQTITLWSADTVWIQGLKKTRVWNGEVKRVFSDGMTLSVNFDGYYEHIFEGTTFIRGKKYYVMPSNNRWTGTSTQNIMTVGNKTYKLYVYFAQAATGKFPVTLYRKNDAKFTRPDISFCNDPLTEPFRVYIEILAPNTTILNTLGNYKVKLAKWSSTTSVEYMISDVAPIGSFQELVIPDSVRDPLGNFLTVFSDYYPSDVNTHYIDTQTIQVVTPAGKTI